MTCESFYKELLAYIRKDERGGSLSPDEFNKMAPTAQYDLFNLYYDQWERSQKATDALLPFKVFNESVTVLNNKVELSDLAKTYVHLIGEPRFTTVQYHIYVEGSYRTYNDDGDLYRTGQRNSTFVLDKALTATGFDGIEDTDWVNISVDSAGGALTYRDGNRGGNYVVDAALTVTGYWGIEDADWVNVKTAST